MVKNFKGWLKIYLFYGVVFFLLGLFGSLASDLSGFQAWSNHQKESLVRVWSYIVQSESAVPAFTSQSGKIILQVYDPENSQTMTPFKTFAQDLYNQLKNHFQQVLIMPVENMNTNSWESANLYSSSILIGFKKTQEISKKGLIMKNQFFFSLPEADSSLIAGKLIQELANPLITFYLRKGTSSQNTIYELAWEQKNSNDQGSSQEDEVFSAFMRIMNQGIIPTVGSPNLQ
jgi:hypothetical protein